MKAKDIMTSPVISIAPDATVREVAALLLEMRISAVPVLEAGRLVGIVSEADLLHRHEIGTDGSGRRSWWLRLFGTDASAAQYVKSHATRARDIMTREVVTVAPDTPLERVASLLESRRIRRVPVLRGERLVGIVSRSNLVQALAASRPAAKRAVAATDGTIRERLAAELAGQPWWRSTYANVVVTDGVVHFWGDIGDERDRDAARVAAENVPGVRAVEDHRFRIYDMTSMI
jgi:CBS domain-containing protein